MRAEQETVDEIMATLGGLADAYAKRDMEAVLSFFAPDEDVCVIGSGPNDIRFGKDEIKIQLEGDWAESPVATMRFNVCAASCCGNVAWVFVDRFTAKEEKRRLTVVLEKRDGRWLIMQWHNSRLT